MEKEKFGAIRKIRFSFVLLGNAVLGLNNSLLPLTHKKVNTNKK